MLAVLLLSPSSCQGQGVDADVDVVVVVVVVVVGDRVFLGVPRVPAGRRRGLAVLLRPDALLVRLLAADQPLHLPRRGHALPLLRQRHGLPHH